MNSGPPQAAQPGYARDRDILRDYEIEDDPADRLPEWQVEELVLDSVAADSDAPSDGTNIGTWILGGTLVFLALAWLSVAGWIYLPRPVPRNPAAIMNLVAIVSTPLVLLGIVWLILGYSPRRRTERFARAVMRLRGESQALESVLEIVAAKLEENQARLTGEAAKLMTLGDEATDRLGRVTHYLAKEGKTLERQTEALEAAGNNARVDIGVLLHDLPRAEEQARSVASAMREAGLTAHEQAGALESQLSALTARGREADEVVGGAAQRLGAHLARVETTASSATEKLDEATIGMTAAIDGAMSRAAEALDQSRSSLDAQGSAMLATIEQSRAALSEAGDEAARNLGHRLDRIGVKIEGLAGQIASQDEASRSLVARLGEGLADLDQRFTVLRESGLGGAEQLQGSLAEVRSLAQALIGELGGGHERADALLERLGVLSGSIGAVTGQLRDEVPATLAQVEQQAERARAIAGEIAPEIAAIEASAGGAVARLGEAEASVARQREALEAMTAGIGQEFSSLDARLSSLRKAGVGGAEQLRDSFASLGSALQQMLHDMGGGEERADRLIERFDGLRQSLAALGEEFEQPVGGALARVEEQAGRTRAAIDELVPTVAAIEASAEIAAARLDQTEASVARQREAIETLLGRLTDGSAEAEERLRALGTAAGDADQAAAKLTRDTGPELIEALLRVRDAAAQAADRAREAIASAIPESAAKLAEESRKAVSGAISGPVEQQMNELVKVAEAAVETARHASERLTRQLLTIGETAAAIEQRFDESRRDHEEREGESLSRHIALLTESLNSAAIDVTKILSNEVTDAAWAAYLKGDRGVFTRRAVRLLSSTEQREILRHYQEDAEFREHVSRYVHDFELMMRRVLADRDGAPLSVTILSSDMGKLYVALAQAIERLRK